MSRTGIRGTQIIDGTIQSIDIEDGGIWREDLNITSTGKAVIRKLVNDFGIAISYDGVDSGTGDVTVELDLDDHKAIDQLVHALAEDSYTEITYNGAYPWRVDSEITYTDSGKTTKIRERNYTYNSTYFWRVDSEEIKQYDGVGSLVETLTKTYTYSSITKLTTVDEALS